VPADAFHARFAAHDPAAQPPHSYPYLPDASARFPSVIVETYTAPVEPCRPNADTLVLLWRIEQFGRLGFRDRDAWALARSEADLGTARQLLRGGCAVELALQILA
jgi:hypothetical protein